VSPNLLCKCDSGYISSAETGYAPCSPRNPVISTHDFNSDSTGGWFNLHSGFTVASKYSIKLTSDIPVTWSITAITNEAHSPGTTYSSPVPALYTQGDSLTKSTSADLKTFYISLPSGYILDNGTQGGYVYITIQAVTPQNGSSSITIKGYGYPYVIYNWDKTIGPNSYFGMYLPYKASNSSLKYSYLEWASWRGGGAYGLNTGKYTNSIVSIKKELKYSYDTRQILSVYNSYCLTGAINNKCWFNACNTSNSQKFKFAQLDGTTGYWYSVADGANYQLNGGLNSGNNYQLWGGSGWDGNARMQNIA
jgi:hypothetical protein